MGRMMNDDTPHERWIKRPRHDAGEKRQCMNCRYYIPLRGSVGADWGVCCNAQSQYDATLCFEHDGCDKYKTVPFGKAAH